MTALGRPRLHHREIDSTNRRARELAAAGAPHGTLVTAGVQTAGRGRQGRRWEAPEGSAVLCSLILHEFDALLSLRVGLAVADVAGEGARVKWPNDVQVDGRKVAGVLVEGRPHEGWAVVGIGVNVSAAPPDVPNAGTLARDDAEAVLAELLAALEQRLAEAKPAALEALRARDALLGEPVRWEGGEGVADGIDADGGLRVKTEAGERVLSAGEVHLGR